MQHAHQHNKRFNIYLVPGTWYIFRAHLDPFRTAVTFWGHTSLILSTLSPERDCSPKREVFFYDTPPIIFSFYLVCIYLIVRKVNPPQGIY